MEKFRDPFESISNQTLKKAYVSKATLFTHNLEDAPADYGSCSITNLSELGWLDPFPDRGLDFEMVYPLRSEALNRDHQAL